MPGWKTHRRSDMIELLCHPFVMLTQVFQTIWDKSLIRRATKLPIVDFRTPENLLQSLQRFLEGKSPCDRRRLGKRMSDQEFKALQKRKSRNMIWVQRAFFALSFVSVFAFT